MLNPKQSNMTAILTLKIPTFGSLGFLLKMSLCGGSVLPRANAGGTSAIRLAHKIITGVKGTGRPITTA